jgi:uncharacterized protein (TIGR01777 family)
MRCVLSGGTGFIGGRLAERLRRNGDEVRVWSRRGAGAYQWDPLKSPPALESLEGTDVVVHLAGEPVAQRWNDEVKQRIRDSRVLGTRRLVDSIARVANRPKLLVSASAIGFYGSRGDEVLTEESGPGKGFLVDVCREWEAEADRAANFGLRVVKLRIGFVLGMEGGALAQMLTPFKMGVGGRMGNGKQWMPWVHVEDVTEMMVHVVREEGAAGVWNVASPNPVRNADFTHELARAVHRPAVFPVPQFALKMAFGELAQHMLDSARVVPAVAEKAGFRFRYPELRDALKNLIR